MKPAYFLVASFVLALSLPVSSGMLGRPLPRPEDPPVSRFIVKPAAGVRDIATVAGDDAGRVAGLLLKASRRMSQGSTLVEVDQELPVATARDVARRMMATGHYRYVVPDLRRHAEMVPNDPRYSEQWHLQPSTSAAGGANFQTAWDSYTGSPAVVVAVLDTGLARHNDIDTNLADGLGQIVPGYDFIACDGRGCPTAGDGNGRDADPSDPGDFFGRDTSSWHGTHVTGTIAALTNNSLGVSGAAPNVRVMPVRVLGRGGGYDSDIIDAINWVAGESVPDAPALTSVVKVINLSLGGDGPCDEPMQEAVDNAVAAGITVVIAAGNESDPASQHSPGNCDNVITVHAHNIQGGEAWYSNFGPDVEISGPGGDDEVDTEVLSTIDGGTRTPLFDSKYANYQGTSMATPHVAAAAALLYSKNINLTPAQVLAALTAGSRPFPAGAGSPCNTSLCGAGMLDASLALAQVATEALADITPEINPPAMVTDQERAQMVTFPTVTISTVSMPVTTVVSGATDSAFSVDGGAFSSSARLVQPGSTVQVRHRAAAVSNAQATSTLGVGALQLSFVSQTLPFDIKPDPFAFAARTNVALNATMTSLAITISGIDTPAPVSITGGSYNLGCAKRGVFTSGDGEITNGMRVCVQHQAAATPGTTSTTTLTIGGVSGTFSSTTIPPDTTPSGFSFGALSAVPLSSVVTSKTVLIRGINTASPVSVAGGEYSLGCAPDGFTSAAGSILPGQSLCVRHTSAALPNQITTTSLTIGGIIGTFISRTPK